MVEQRYNTVMEVLVPELTVTQVAERYGVSRQSVHTWMRRYQDAGMAGLADRSHRPASCPHQMSPQVEARICSCARNIPGGDRACCGMSWAGLAWACVRLVTA